MAQVMTRIAAQPFACFVVMFGSEVSFDFIERFVVQIDWRMITQLRTWLAAKLFV